MLSFHESSIRKLKIFVTVVDCGGFSAAQTMLGASSATISVQMKELEERLGMKLCQRGRSGFHITDQGRAVYEAAQSVFGALSNFNLAAAEIRDKLVGELKIGMQANMATNPAFKMSQTIRQFQTHENNVTFRLEEASSADQQSRVLEGRYDLCAGLFPNRIPGLDYTKLFSESVALYCAADHPLCGVDNGDVSVEDIGNYPVVSAGSSEVLILRKPQSIATPTALTESMDAAILLILSGQYIGFLPTHFAKIWQQKGLVQPILPDRLTTEIDFHLITKRGRRDNNVVDTFIAEILEAHKQH